MIVEHRFKRKMGLERKTGTKSEVSCSSSDDWRIFCEQTPAGPVIFHVTPKSDYHNVCYGLFFSREQGRWHNRNLQIHRCISEKRSCKRNEGLQFLMTFALRSGKRPTGRSAFLDEITDDRSEQRPAAHSIIHDVFSSLRCPHILILTEMIHFHCVCTAESFRQILSVLTSSYFFTLFCMR